MTNSLVLLVATLLTVDLLRFGQPFKILLDVSTRRFEDTADSHRPNAVVPSPRDRRQSFGGELKAGTAGLSVYAGKNQSFPSEKEHALTSRSNPDDSISCLYTSPGHTKAEA